MMDGKMMGGQMAMAGAQAALGSPAPASGMMMDAKDMHCMPATAKTVGAPHDRPDAAPK